MPDDIAAMDLKAIARALGGEVAGGQALVPGPNHSKKDRSLAVKLDPNARDGFVVFSHANDDPIVCKDYVRERLGLAPFTPSKPNGSKGKRSASNAPAPKSLDALRRAANARRDLALAKGAADGKPGGKAVVATYPYHDAAGMVAYVKLKYEPKDFRFRMADGTWGEKSRYLYCLPQLIAAPDAVIFVTEGEKDADNLAALGLITTTPDSDKWPPGLAEPLCGRTVVVLRDMDTAGAARALKAAEAVYQIASSVRIVALPGLTGEEDSKDVSDWLAQHDEVAAEDFVKMCVDAPLWEPSAAGGLVCNNRSGDEGVRLEDFYAYLPAHNYFLCRRASLAGVKRRYDGPAG